MPLLARNSGVFLRGGSIFRALLRGETVLWNVLTQVLPERVSIASSEPLGFSAHSFLDTAIGTTGYHGGILPSIWQGEIHETYQGGSYLSERWALNGPDRTATAYSAFVFTEMANPAVGYADPASAEGIATLQQSFWHVLNAQSKGAQFACLYWAWTPPSGNAANDDDTMAKAQYVRQWLNARPEITIPVFVIPTPYFIRQAVALNATYNPEWEIFADEIGHLNSSWQEVDDGLSWLLWMMFRAEKAPADAGRSAFLQALIDMGWDLLTQYECTGLGQTAVPAFPVASDPLPNPEPLDTDTPASIEGGENQIVIQSLTSPSSLSVTGGENQIIISET